MFGEFIRKVVDSVEGGVGGLIMGLDGIAIETYVSQGHNVDINTLGMEFSFIVTQVRKATESLEVGQLKEFTIKAEKLTLVIRMLNDEYFLATALSADGNFGKCRFLMRIAEPKILAELA